MTLERALNELAEAVADEGTRGLVSRRWGTVDAVNSDGTVDVDLSASGIVLPSVRVLSLAGLAAGDEVAVDLAGSAESGKRSVLVLGKVATAPAAIGVVVTSTVYFDADPSGNTSSNTYVDVSGSSFSFTKKLTATKLQFTIYASLYTSAGTPAPVVGIRINSVDYDGVDMTFNTTNEHSTLAGVREIGAGVVSAGTYTVQVRWHTTGGNQINMDSGDNVHVLMQEIAA